MKFAYIDFEFNGIKEPKLNLVSCSILCTDDGAEVSRHEYWLYYDEIGQRDCEAKIAELIAKGYVFVSFVLEAEARSIMALNPELTYKAIDLQLEYKCLLNKNFKLAYGKQFIKGREIVTKPPVSKWKRLDKEGYSEDKDLHHKPEMSLSAAIYKMLDIKIDTDEKNEVRELIYKPGWQEKIPANKERIMLYNMTDVLLLPALLNAIRKKMKTIMPTREWLGHAYRRAEYSIATAKMVEVGYPINRQKIDKFVSNIKPILKLAAEACLLPEAPQSFRWAKKDEKYVMNEKAVREWVAAQNIPKWRMTDGGKSGIKKLSLSRDAFDEFFDSDSPGFAGAFCRYLRTKQSLNGFSPGSKDTFFDFIGSDGRVRPNFGIYTAQSSRSQPGAKGFIPLKAQWMRNFIDTTPDKAIVQADFSSEEFAVAAIVSQDKEMMKAYESGDVYMAFGKAADLIPPEGTRETHKPMRDLCKSLVLGISYDMSAGGLAPRLSKITGQEITKEYAETLIHKFYEVYRNYKKFKDENFKQYMERGYLKLSDGWVMWGDNDNSRSIGNCPIQGESGVIMRECVKLAQTRGLNVIFTNHDSLAIEFLDPWDFEAIRILRKSMEDGFNMVMKKFGTIVPIQIDCDAWSKVYANADLPKIPRTKFSSEYIPTKGHEDFLRYKPFFE